MAAVTHTGMTPAPVTAERNRIRGTKEVFRGLLRASIEVSLSLARERVGLADTSRGRSVLPLRPTQTRKRRPRHVLPASTPRLHLTPHLGSKLIPHPPGARELRLDLLPVHPRPEGANALDEQPLKPRESSKARERLPSLEDKTRRIPHHRLVPGLGESPGRETLRCRHQKLQNPNAIHMTEVQASSRRCNTHRAGGGPHVAPAWRPLDVSGPASSLLLSRTTQRPCLVLDARRLIHGRSPSSPLLVAWTAACIRSYTSMTCSRQCLPNR